ncbi:hypothetical protein ACHAWF_003135 [Thalassiosira exigua]
MSTAMTVAMAMGSPRAPLRRTLLLSAALLAALSSRPSPAVALSTPSSGPALGFGLAPGAGGEGLRTRPRPTRRVVGLGGCAGRGAELVAFASGRSLDGEVRCESALDLSSSEPLPSRRDVSRGGRRGSSASGRRAVDGRRRLLVGLSTAAIAPISLSAAGNAMENPLNLKGTFWETGQLYEKSNVPPPEDDGDFLSVLEDATSALRSPELSNAIGEGRYGPASRLLRGGLISESRVRVAANALIDALPEEDDERIYRASESFRRFVRYWDALDTEVEAAGGPFGGGGGKDGGDPRMRILTRLGEAQDTLEEFLGDVRGAPVP